MSTLSRLNVFIQAQNFGSILLSLEKNILFLRKMLITQETDLQNSTLNSFFQGVSKFYVGVSQNGENLFVDCLRLPLGQVIFPLPDLT